MLRILVTGADGQLGKELRKIAPRYTNVMFTFADRRRLDILDIEKFEQTLKIFWPHFIINAAAYTNVEKAEDDQRIAFAVNSEAVGNMATICKRYKIRFLHISSDYVYHPDHNRIILETTPPSPKGIYARSKYQGELKLLESGASSIILRTSWLYSAYGNNFVKTMLSLSDKKQPIKVINDQIGAPTYAGDLALAIMKIIAKTVKDKIPWKGDIFNYSNRGKTSWYDFAKEIFRQAGKANVELIPVSSTEYPSNVPRPHNSRLSVAKLKDYWKLDVRPWEVALGEMLENLKISEKKPWRP